jgi:hypothetical protein
LIQVINDYWGMGRLRYGVLAEKDGVVVVSSVRGCGEREPTQYWKNGWGIYNYSNQLWARTLVLEKSEYRVLCARCYDVDKDY